MLPNTLNLKNIFSTINENSVEDTVSPNDFINTLLNKNMSTTFEEARDVIYELLSTKTLSLTNSYRLKIKNNSTLESK